MCLVQISIQNLRSVVDVAKLGAEDSADLLEEINEAILLFNTYKDAKFSVRKKINVEEARDNKIPTNKKDTLYAIADGDGIEMITDPSEKCQFFFVKDENNIFLMQSNAACERLIQANE